MRNTRPLFAVILIFVRRRIDQSKFHMHPECRRQRAVIKTYARIKDREISRWNVNQSTYRGMRFWNNPSFLKAAELAHQNGGDVIVFNAISLIEKLDLDTVEPAWKELRKQHPDLISAVHFQRLRDPRPFHLAFTDVMNRKHLKRWQPSTAAQPARPPIHLRIASTRGGVSTKSNSNSFARLMAPILSEILSSNPEITLSGISDALNRRGQVAARGGRWHPSSARNLLSRCRGLKLIST